MCCSCWHVRRLALRCGCCCCSNHQTASRGVCWLLLKQLAHPRCWLLLKLLQQLLQPLLLHLPVLLQLLRKSLGKHWHA
jgi:hypothetical protein